MSAFQSMAAAGQPATQQAAGLVELDINARQVTRTLAEKLLPLLQHFKQEKAASMLETGTAAPGSQETANSDLSAAQRYRLIMALTALSGQLGTLWDSMRAEFGLQVVAPCALPSAQQLPIAQVLNSGLSLGSPVASSEGESSAVPQEALDVEELQALHEALREHGDCIDRVLDFSAAMLRDFSEASKVREKLLERQVQFLQRKLDGRSK